VSFLVVLPTTELAGLGSPDDELAEAEPFWLLDCKPNKVVPTQEKKITASY